MHMADPATSAQRSAMMARVRGKNSKPELTVRKALHAAGFRFRLHRRDLPGTPDLALPSLGTVVFVHGCFWHGHDCRKGRTRPASNVAFWNAKLDRNRDRDAEAVVALERRGWQVEIVWECEAATGIAHLIDRLTLRRAARSNRSS